ncbi:MAG TPA: hypothetical protein EYP59_15705 [Thiotrichaceae bacterium]|nr:hypothetical protein [Thiotrichaceae bacterium]
MKKLVLTIPSLKKRHKLECQIESIYEKIASNQSTILTLAKLRDTLLPKLMSGEARMKSI